MKLEHQVHATSVHNVHVTGRCTCACYWQHDVHVDNKDGLTHMPTLLHDMHVHLTLLTLTDSTMYMSTLLYDVHMHLTDSTMYT